MRPVDPNRVCVWVRIACSGGRMVQALHYACAVHEENQQTITLCDGGDEPQIHDTEGKKPVTKENL